MCNLYSNDSEFYIDEEKFRLLRIRRIARCMGLREDNPTYFQCMDWIASHYLKDSQNPSLTEMEKENIKALRQFISDNFKVYGIYNTIDYALDSNFVVTSKVSKSFYKASCFTVLPINKRMWDQYADHSRGFCLEYSIPVDFLAFKVDGKTKCFLLPILYTAERVDYTEELEAWGYGKDISIEDFILSGCLRKSIAWCDQSEWRLISNLPEPKSIPFFKPSRIYLGKNMPRDQRNFLSRISRTKGISCYNMVDDKSDKGDVFIECLCSHNSYMSVFEICYIPASAGKIQCFKSDVTYENIPISKKYVNLFFELENQNSFDFIYDEYRSDSSLYRRLCLFCHVNQVMEKGGKGI